MKKNWIITIVLLIVVGGGAFFGGMKYQQSKQSNFIRQMGEGRVAGRNSSQFQGGQGDRLNFRPVSGEIISADEKSITVKLQDNSSKIVLLADTTEINKASETTREDLKVGEKVAILGQENSDGSVTAQSIQLNPVFRGN